jgi:tetratricopeptide (TPR) repeat protein
MKQECASVQELELLRRRQQQGWLAGEKITAECLLQQHPVLQGDADAVLELIYNEVVLRQRSQEKPSLAEYQRRFPHLVERLELLFEVHSALDEDSWPMAGGPTLRAPAKSGIRVPSDLPVVAGYEILREVGRGAVGAVYEALQKSLNRRVALKMLLAGSCAGTEERTRFRTEAEAMGRLHHVHIVPVHEVGESDSRPYLVMELIHGRSLAQHLSGTPLSPRAAAALVEKLALATDYAHRQGIVHRDLKPANVLLQMEDSTIRIEPIVPAQSSSAIVESVTPKITDFGLAKLLAGDAGLTQSDAFVGTPSYMAPEQAEHSRDVGPAADIYALGAILYEMLTGRPPFRGETVLETLLQVKGVEPVPPSRLRPNVPRDLTTICLKCLQKDPARRYLTANELAEDLQRFLAEMPITARPVGTLERSWRWCCRKPAIAGLLAGITLVLTGGFSGVIWQWRRAEANALLGLEQRQRADEQRRRAEASYRLAREGLEECVKKIAENPRLRSGPLEDLRREVLQAELLFYQKFVELRGDEPDFQAERGRAFLRLGKLTQVLATQAEALGPSQQALAIFADLARDWPGVAEYQAELAACHNNMGLIYRFLRQRTEAEQAYRNALLVQELLVRDYPLHAGYQSTLAKIQNNLAVLYQDMERLPEALEIHHEALALRKSLVHDHAEVADYQSDLATTYNNLAALYRSDGRLSDAVRADQNALALRKKLVHDHDNVAAYRNDLAATYNNLGISYETARRVKEAAGFQQQALALRKELVAEHPAVREFGIDLAGTQCNLARMLSADASQLDAALDLFREASQALEIVLAKEPRHVTARQFLRNVHINRANSLTAFGRHAEALTSWDRLVQLSETSERWPRLSRALARARVKEYEQATAEAYAIAADRNVSSDDLYALSVVCALSAAAAGDAALVEQYGARSVELLRSAVAKGFKDTDKLKKDKDMEAVRRRPDFNALLTNLGNASGPNPGK